MGCITFDKANLDNPPGDAALSDSAIGSGGGISGTETTATGGSTTNPADILLTGGTGGMLEAGAIGTGGTYDTGGTVGTAAQVDAGTGGIVGTSPIGTGGIHDTGGTAGSLEYVDAGTGTETSALSAGCALVMHLDEASWNGTPGEVKDSCTHNHGVAVKGSESNALLPYTTTAGYFAGAGDFDGTTSCIQVPDDPSLHATTQLTLAAWIFPTALNPVSNGIIAKRTDYQLDSSYTMFLWSTDSATYELWADIGVDRVHGALTFSTNRWYHVAVVFDGDLPANQRVRLYVNGAQDGEFADDATTVPALGAPLYVGCLPLAGPAQAFAGTIDETVVWTRALGPDELLKLYLAKSPLEDTPSM